MTSNIQQNTENAKHTEQISVKAVKGIDNLNSAAKQSLLSIKEIAEKIGIINDIAFQTNLLQLLKRQGPENTGKVLPWLRQRLVNLLNEVSSRQTILILWPILV